MAWLLGNRDARHIPRWIASMTKQWFDTTLLCSFLLYSAAAWCHYY